MTNLFLAEHDYQVRDFIQRFGAYKGQWIALGPSAMAYLDTVGMKYHIPEDFYKPEDLQSVCEKGHRNVEEFCRKMDALLMDQYSELRERQMFPFLFNIFPLIVLFDSLHSRIFKLKKILEVYPSCTLSVHKSSAHPWGAFELCFGKEETLWGYVAALEGWAATVNIIEDPTAGKRKSHGSLLNAARKMINRSIWWSTLFRHASRKRYQSFFDFLGSETFNKGSLLVVNEGNEWSHTFSAFKERGYRILLVNESYFNNLLIDGFPNGSIQRKEVFNIESAPDIMGYFKLQNISFFHLMHERISWIFSSMPDRFYFISNRISDVIQKYKVRAVLTSGCASGSGHALNQAARYQGVPVFTWQHGFVCYEDRISQFNDYGDCLTSDITFTYGDEAVKAYTVHGRPFNSKVIPVGSPSLDVLQSLNGLAPKVGQNPGTPKRVLYTTTNYYQNNWYYGMAPGWSDPLFYRDQSEIVKILVDDFVHRYDAEIIIKLHPSIEYDDPPWVKRVLGVEKIRVVKNEERYCDLLKKVDIVILDFPSTTLLQAIAAGCFIFALSKHWRYPPRARTMLKSRAVCHEEVEILMREVKEFLSGGHYKADLSDRGFLNEFGTYQDDGTGVLRAVNEVTKRIEGSVLCQT